MSNLGKKHWTWNTAWFFMSTIMLHRRTSVQDDLQYFWYTFVILWSYTRAVLWTTFTIIYIALKVTKQKSNSQCTIQLIICVNDSLVCLNTDKSLSIKSTKNRCDDHILTHAHSKLHLPINIHAIVGYLEISASSLRGTFKLLSIRW